MATKDYNAIAKKRIHKPSSINRLPRFHVFSRRKLGKTTFAASAPRCLIIDPERGTDEMKKKDPDVWPVYSWEDMEDLYNYAKLGQHPYDWFQLDGMTKICNMALRYIMRVQEERNLERKPGIVDRRDYFKSGELVKAMITNFHNLPYGLVFTSHERQEAPNPSGGDDEIEEDEDIEQVTSQQVADLPKGVRGFLNSTVDVIGRLYVVRVEVKGVMKPQRRLWIAESEKYDTGYRSDFGPLPDYLKFPTVPKLTRLIRTGEATQRKETNSA